MLCRFIEHLAVRITILALGMFASCAFGQDQLTVGPTSIDCASPIIIGATRCGVPQPPKPVEKKKEAVRKLPPHESAQPESPADPVVGGVKESEVNNFLANYGKPSREAVRAILNPSDDNIAAMLKIEQQQLAVTAYTAQRRVELSQASNPPEKADLSQADLPSLIGMRLTVIVAPDCAHCESILPIVNQLVSEFPSVDARIGVVGQADAKDFVVKTAALGVYLPMARISSARLQQLHIDALPAIVVGDSRFPGEAVITDPITNALELERVVVQMRKTNEKQAAAAAAKRSQGGAQ